MTTWLLIRTYSPGVSDLEICTSPAGLSIFVYNDGRAVGRCVLSRDQAEIMSTTLHSLLNHAADVPENLPPRSLNQ